MKNTKFIFAFIFMSLLTQINAQNNKIKWITFEQLEDSLKVKPKKVFISFYADWCAYCKKMDKVAFKNDEIIQTLNSKYYAIKFNAESRDTIIFESKKYINNQLGKSRTPAHEIALLLASRKERPFTLPVNLILNNNLEIEKRSFEYLSSKKLLSLLNYE